MLQHILNADYNETVDAVRQQTPDDWRIPSGMVCGAWNYFTENCQYWGVVGDDALLPVNLVRTVGDHRFYTASE